MVAVVVRLASGRSQVGSPDPGRRGRRTEPNQHDTMTYGAAAIGFAAMDPGSGRQEDTSGGSSGGAGTHDSGSSGGSGGGSGGGGWGGFGGGSDGGSSGGDGGSSF
ncbi:hypothetical protein ACH0AH_14085 [Microbacterium paludicola]|uniref:hypothetical protein n=1 Tax=Microbacterium paludicola TaxID=300019 RepID=UPI003879E623